MSNASAAEIVDAYVFNLTSQYRMFSKEPYVAALVANQIESALSGGQPSRLPVPVAPANPRMVREAQFIAQDAVVRRLWQINRIVYDIDPDLWAELGNTDPETVVPAGLFEKLPHPDPFIALPVPLILPIDETHQMRIRGFFVVGRAPGTLIDGYVQVSTHAESATGDLGLLIGAEVETLDGKPYMAWDGVQDMVWSRVTLDTGRERDTTVRELIDAISSRFDRDPTAGQFNQTIPESITQAVSALIYLCTVNADLRPLPVTANRRKAKGIAVKPPRVVRVGYQVGAALRAYRRTLREDPRPGTGRTVRPHIRRSHFHTYKTGPGRTESVVKWLAPIPINVDIDAQKTTVVKVK